MKRWFILLLMGAGLTLSASAQERLEGTVTDKKGNPMPGVRVSSTDKKVSAVALTELDGKFRMDADARPKRVIAEYVGFRPQEVRTKRTPLNVKLKKESRFSYQGELSFGYATAGKLTGDFADSRFSECDFQRIFLETVHGIRFNKYFYAGLGLTIQLSPKYDGGGIIAPFLDFKAYLPVTRKFMPYVEVDAGYGLFGFYEDDVLYAYPDYSDREEYDRYATRSYLSEDTVYNDYEREDHVYLAYGVGITFGHLNVGLGVHQLMPCGLNNTHYSFYVKAGVKF